MLSISQSRGALLLTAHENQQSMANKELNSRLKASAAHVKPVQPSNLTIGCAQILTGRLQGQVIFDCSADAGSVMSLSELGRPSTESLRDPGSSHRAVLS